MESPKSTIEERIAEFVEAVSFQSVVKEIDGIGIEFIINKDNTISFNKYGSVSRQPNEIWFDIFKLVYGTFVEDPTQIAFNNPDITYDLHHRKKDTYFRVLNQKTKYYIWISMDQFGYVYYGIKSYYSPYNSTMWENHEKKGDLICAMLHSMKIDVLLDILLTYFKESLKDKNDNAGIYGDPDKFEPDVITINITNVIFIKKDHSFYKIGFFQFNYRDKGIAIEEHQFMDFVVALQQDQSERQNVLKAQLDKEVEHATLKYNEKIKEIRSRLEQNAGVEMKRLVHLDRIITSIRK